METIFSVSNAHLGRLSPEEAVKFFRDLLWAEARRIGVGFGQINMSSRITVADGGIDATVNGAISQSDIIKSEYCGYQIKTGTTFKPHEKAQIRKELFDDKDPVKENLGSSVRECFDRDGTYILVCFGIDLVAPEQNLAEQHLRTFIEACGYKEPKLEVWSQNKIIGLLQDYPSLALEVNGNAGNNFDTHDSWSKFGNLRQSFYPGKFQLEFIQALETQLRESEDAFHVHVGGEPGIGKTRVVLEATRSEDLRPLVLYFGSPDHLISSSLLSNLRREDNQQHALIIIDECDVYNRELIWNGLKQCGRRIRLITIYNESEVETSKINYIEIPPLDADQLKLIIQSYGVPEHEAVRWTEFCSGYPRVAHHVGSCIRDLGGDVLQRLSKSYIWKRFVVDRDQFETDEERQRVLVLRYLALFKKFGYSGPVVQEAKVVAEMIREADPQITWPRFQEIIRALRERKVLQGENILYITPKLLHINLWADWWDTYGTGFNRADFLAKLPSSLKEGFYDMFKYARESRAANKVVKDLLGPNGLFEGDEFLITEEGANFFLSLTEADPEAALRCLNRTIRTWSKARLQQFTIGRRQIVWALERIVIWRDLFVDAARLLLKLGEAENESWSNNASGIFVNLFSPAPAPVAPTEAPPLERISVLKEALESQSTEQRILALKACEAALNTRFLGRIAGAEHQGLRKTANLWRPKTYGEIYEGFRAVWSLVEDKISALEGEERIRAAKIIVSRSRELARIGALRDYVFSALENIIRQEYLPKKEILATVIETLRYDGDEMEPALKKRWERVEAELSGTGFSARLRRYVGLSLLADEYDRDAEYKGEAQREISILAHDAFEQPELLRSELEWLVTDEAENGYSFGYQLGKLDDELKLITSFLYAQRRAPGGGNINFVSGYLRSIFERRVDLWEEILDGLAGDDDLRSRISELTCLSGMSDRAALRVIGLAQEGITRPEDLDSFRFGNVVAALSADIFARLIEFLLQISAAETVSLALDLVHLYYVHGDREEPIPEELTLKVLVHPNFFGASESKRSHTRDSYYWARVAEAFLVQYPAKSLELAKVMLENFGSEGSIMDQLPSHPIEMLTEITRKHPEQLWKIISEYLGPPVDTRAFAITHWLRAGEFMGRDIGPIQFIPLNALWQWVAEDVDKRAWYLATFVPSKLSCARNEICLARELLVQYGHREDVRRNLIANYATETFWGPASSHYEERKRVLLELRKIETDANIRLWIDDYIEDLDEAIEKAKVREERSE